MVTEAEFLELRDGKAPIVQTGGLQGTVARA